MEPMNSIKKCSEAMNSNKYKPNGKINCKNNFFPNAHLDWKPQNISLVFSIPFFFSLNNH